MSTALSLFMRDREIGKHGDIQLWLASTLDPGDDNDRITIASAMLAHQGILEAPGPRPIVNIMLWDSVETVDTGEERIIRRTGFVDTAGIVWSTTSDQMLEKIATLCRLFGPPPWTQKPIWLQFGSSLSKTQRTYHWFRPVAPPTKPEHNFINVAG